MPTDRPPNRLLFLDGLRGVAALAVLLFHVAHKMQFLYLPQGYAAPLNTAAASVGSLGVEIFFVLSGFVIAYSLRDARITPKFIATFAARRSLRLDPPYYAIIAITLALTLLFKRFLHATTYPFPTLPALAANLVYLQGITHQPHILDVFWTLCFEIQFYLAYILLQYLAQSLTRSPAAAGTFLTTLLSLTGLASLLAFTQDQSVHGWSYNWWYLFSFGTLLCRGLLHPRSSPLAPASALFLILATCYAHHPEPLAGALTGLLIFAAIQRNTLRTWLANPPIQYLGRISYSLYLTHLLTLQILAGILYRLPSSSRFHSIPLYLVLVLTPIACAHLFYLTLEKPSHQWATRFGRRPIPAPPPAPIIYTTSYPPPVKLDAI